MFPHALHVLLVMDLENQYCKRDIVPKALSLDGSFYLSVSGLEYRYNHSLNLS